MKKFISVLLAAITMFFGFSLTSCGGKIKGKIDAPTETVLAELGSYPIPVYEVVDETGMVLSGYTVSVKSIKDPDGNDVKQAYNSITVETAGVYTFVYTTGTKDVADVTVKVDFADRTAPTITIDENAIPAFFMTGNTYKVPVYSIAGEPDASKCYTKVLHTDADGNSQKEVAIVQGTFEAKENTGKYLIWIHVEDAAGNFNDYKYSRSVDGPAAVDPDTVLYFDDEFGERQVSPREDLYSGEVVLKKVGEEINEDAIVHGNDNGSFKVTFNNVKTLNNEAYFVIDNPAITDVSGYNYLEMWIYNDNDFDASAGTAWAYDTVLKSKEWTRVIWGVEDCGMEGKLDDWGNVCSTAEKKISSANIIGAQLRFMGFPANTDGNPYPRGTFYISPMMGRYGKVNEVAELDYASGAERVSVYQPDFYTGEYSTEKAYKDAEGSYKITMTAEPTVNKEIYLRLTDPLLCDVRAYDYLTLYIYNANNYDAKVGTIWASDQVLIKNSWNKIKFPVSIFTENNIFDIANEKPGQMLRPWNITGFTVRIFDFGENTTGTFYLSSIRGEVALEKESGILSFAEAEDGDKMTVVNKSQYTGEFSTEEKYGNETGSWKVTVKYTGDDKTMTDNIIYTAIAKPEVKDVSKYDYLSVYIYNPNDFDAMAGILWGADTTLKAGKWTELRIDTSATASKNAESWKGGHVDGKGNPIETDGKPATRVTGMSDITNLILRIWDVDGQTNVQKEGTVFYFSGVRAVSNSQTNETKLYAFDEAAPETDTDGYFKVEGADADKITVASSTEQKFGDETASTKITYNISDKSDISGSLSFGKPLQDASCFDYITFAVYNNTNQDFYAGFEWGGDTLCKKGEWTVVKWKLDAGRVKGDILRPLKGLKFRIVAADWKTNFTAGSSVYISAVYGYDVTGLK